MEKKHFTFQIHTRVGNEMPATGLHSIDVDCQDQVDAYLALLRAKYPSGTKGMVTSRGDDGKTVHVYTGTIESMNAAQIFGQEGTSQDPTAMSDKELDDAIQALQAEKERRNSLDRFKLAETDRDTIQFHAAAIREHIGMLQDLGYKVWHSPLDSDLYVTHTGLMVDFNPEKFILFEYAAEPVGTSVSNLESEDYQLVPEHE